LSGGQLGARRRAPLCHSVGSHGSGDAGREAACAPLPTWQAKWAALLAEPGAAPPPGARGLCAGGPEYAAAVLHFGRCMALTARAAAAAAAGDLGEVAGGYADGAAADLARLQARA